MRHQIRVNANHQLKIDHQNIKVPHVNPAFSRHLGYWYKPLPEESCWLETNIPHGGYSDPPSTKTRASLKSISSSKGLKSLSAPSSADLPGRPVMQPSKVQNVFILPKLHSRTLQSRKWKHIDVSNWGESGQWKYDKQLHKQQVPFTHTACPSPCPVTMSSILVQVPLRHPAVLRSRFHLPLPFFGPDVFPRLN